MNTGHVLLEQLHLIVQFGQCYLSAIIVGRRIYDERCPAIDAERVRRFVYMFAVRAAHGSPPGPSRIAEPSFPVEIDLLMNSNYMGIGDVVVPAHFLPVPTDPEISEGQYQR